MADRTIRSILRAEAGQYQATMQAAARATEQVGMAGEQAGARSTKGLAGILSSAQQNKAAWTQVGGTLAGVGAGMLALTGSVLKTGISYNTLQQQSRAALTTLTGSAEAANAQMDKLDAFARTSPFSKQTFIQAQQQMLGFGIEAQKVIPYLDSIQNAVAAFGGSNQQISEIAFIMSQISAAGKITATDLMQLGQRGVDAATLIGSQMGKTGAQIREDITSGSLDAGAALDALAEGMGDRYAGAADNVKNTMTGAFDRVSAAWRDLASDLTEPLVSKNGGGFLVDLTNDAADLMRVVGDLPGPVKSFSGALFALTGAASTLGGGFLLLTPRIVETKAAIDQMGPGAQRTAGALGKLGKAAGIAAAAFVGLQILDEVLASPTKAVAGANQITAAIEAMAHGSNTAKGQLDEIFTRQAGDIAGGLINNSSQQIKGLDDALKVLNEGSLRQFMSSPFFGDSKYDLARESLEKFDETLASLAQTGDTLTAERAFVDFAQQAIDAGWSLEQVNDALVKYNDAVYKAPTSNNPLEFLAEGITEGADKAERSVESLSDAIQRLNDVLSGRADMRSYMASLDAIDESIKENGKSLDIATEKGRNNQAALDDIASSALSVADNLKGADRKNFLRDARAGLVDAAKKFGLSDAAADRLSKKLLGIDGMNVKVKADAETAKAEAAVERVQGKLDKYGLTKAQAETLVADFASFKINNVQQLIDRFGISKKTAQALLNDLASGKISAIINRLNALDGKTATSTVTTNYVINTRRINTVMTRNLKSGPGVADGGTIGQHHDQRRVMAFSTGGSVPGQLQPYGDKVLAFLAPGEEVISNRHGQADRHRALLKAINANRLASGGTVQALANGGRVLGPGGGEADPLQRWTRALKQSKDAIDAERKQRQNLVSKRNDLSQSVRDKFRSDLFGGDVDPFAPGAGAGGLLGLLRGDTAEARAFNADKNALKRKGVKGGFLDAILSQGSAIDVDQLANMSKSELAKIQRAFNTRQRVTASVGAAAGNAAYGAQVREQTKELRAQVASSKRIEKRLNRVEKAVKQAAKDTGREINSGASRGRRNQRR